MLVSKCGATAAELTKRVPVRPPMAAESVVVTAARACKVSVATVSSEPQCLLLTVVLTAYTVLTQ